MKLVGQWFGGSNYGRPHADGFERFSSLRHALVVFEARLNSRRLPFVDVLGPDDGGPEMLLWKLGRDDPDDSRSNSDYPDYRIFCGPRGGVKYEVMSGTENHLRCPSEALTAAIGKLGEVMQRMQR